MKAIEMNHLTKKFGKQMAVDDISLSIDEGEMYGFIGPNGAGKSTTIKLLLNMIFPTSGDATIFGFDCVRDTVSIKEITGYVSSDVRYYPSMTSLDIFNYVGDFHQIHNSKKIIADYIERFDIDPTKKIGQLSLGNKKKIAIVSVLIQQPKLLIMDEPTNGLDPRMQHRLFDVLKEKQQSGTTIFLSSHDLNEVQNYCDRAAFIKQGKIIDIETIGEDVAVEKYISIRGKGLDVQILTNLGGTILREERTSIKFIFSGNLQELMGYLSNLPIDDVSIRNLTLEDKFISMYE